jgi:hypothetical protein
MFPAPKAIVLYVRDTLRLDEMEHFEGTFLEAIIRNASSTVSFPHTTRQNANEALTAELTFTKEVSIENVKDFLQANNLGQESTDVVIVRVSNSYSWKQVNEMIRQTTALFESATANKVYFGWTGDKAAETHNAFESVHRKLSDTAALATPLICPQGYLLSTSGDQPFCFTHFVSMTPTILAGLFVGFFFLFCVYIGLYYLDGIQTPTRYPSVAPPKGKEY